MRWNCPHCQTALAVSDDELGTSWSYSKCYQCANYSLVRKTDVNLVKVDQMPAGEKPLFPQAPDSLKAKQQPAPTRTKVATPEKSPTQVPSQAPALAQPKPPTHQKI